MFDSIEKIVIDKKEGNIISFVHKNGTEYFMDGTKPQVVLSDGIRYQLWRAVGVQVMYDYNKNYYGKNGSDNSTVDLLTSIRRVFNSSKAELRDAKAELLLSVQNAVVPVGESEKKIARNIVQKAARAKLTVDNLCWTVNSGIGSVPKFFQPDYNSGSGFGRFGGFGKGGLESGLFGREYENKHKTTKKTGIDAFGNPIKGAGNSKQSVVEKPTKDICEDSGNGIMPDSYASLLPTINAAYKMLNKIDFSSLDPWLENRDYLSPENTGWCEETRVRKLSEMGQNVLLRIRDKDVDPFHSILKEMRLLFDEVNPIAEEAKESISDFLSKYKQPGIILKNHVYEIDVYAIEQGVRGDIASNAYDVFHDTEVSRIAGRLAKMVAGGKGIDYINNIARIPMVQFKKPEWSHNIANSTVQIIDADSGVGNSTYTTPDVGNSTDATFNIGNSTDVTLDISSSMHATPGMGNSTDAISSIGNSTEATSSIGGAEEFKVVTKKVKGKGKGKKGQRVTAGATSIGETSSVGNSTGATSSIGSTEEFKVVTKKVKVKGKGKGKGKKGQRVTAGATSIGETSSISNSTYTTTGVSNGADVTFGISNSTKSTEATEKVYPDITGRKKGNDEQGLVTSSWAKNATASYNVNDPLIEGGYLYDLANNSANQQFGPQHQASQNLHHHGEAGNQSSSRDGLIGAKNPLVVTGGVVAGAMIFGAMVYGVYRWNKSKSKVDYAVVPGGGKSNDSGKVISDPVKSKSEHSANDDNSMEMGNLLHSRSPSTMLNNLDVGSSKPVYEDTVELISSGR